MSTLSQEFATENYFFQKGYINQKSTFYICSKIDTTYYYFGLLDSQYGFYKNGSSASPIVFLVNNLYDKTTPFSMLFVTSNELFLNITDDNVLTMGHLNNSSFSLISKDGSFHSSIYIDDIYDIAISGKNETLYAFYEDIVDEQKIENVNFILQTDIFTTGDCSNPNTDINSLDNFFRFLNKEQVLQEYSSSNICEQQTKKYIKCAASEGCGDSNCYGIKLDSDSEMLKRDMLNVLPYSNYLLNMVALDIPTDLEYRCEISEKGNPTAKKINKKNGVDVSEVDDPRLWAGIFLLFLGAVSFVVWIFLIKHFRTMKGKSDFIRIFGITISTILTITLVFGGAISLSTAFTERYILIGSIIISSIFALTIVILEIVFVSKGYETEKKEDKELTTKKPGVKKLTNLEKTSKK